MVSRRVLTIVAVVVVLAVVFMAGFMAMSPQQGNTTSIPNTTIPTSSSTTTSESTTTARYVSILITEIELNPPGNDLSKQWVELNNPNDFDVNLGGWKLVTKAGNPKTIVIPEGATILARGFYIVNDTQKWLEIKNESIILKDDDRLVVETFPPFSDEYGDDNTWQRIFALWEFRPATTNAPNE